MEVNPIRSEQDYAQTLDRIDRLMDVELGTPEGDELDILVTLVEVYERRRYEIPSANPIAVIKFVMEQNGLRDKDLVPYIGHSGRVSEVLSGKRKLTIEMIRKIHVGLSIPAENLIQEYEVA